jgi:hypothetical protein
MPFVHRATAMPLDVVLAGSGLEDEFLDRAREVDIGGTGADQSVVRSATRFRVARGGAHTRWIIALRSQH